VIVAGVSALHHDAAISVIDTESSEILFAGHSERYSKIKNDPKLCEGLIRDVKNFAPERVVWYERPNIKRFRRALNFDFSFADEETPRSHLKRFGLDLPVDFVDHHLSHAAAGAFTSPFESATVLVMDAIGEFETTSIWRYDRGVLKKLFSRDYPQSIGLFYSAFTQKAGFRPNEEEYILMGLSAYGSDSVYQDVLRHSFELNTRFPTLKRNYHWGVNDSTFDRCEPKELARATQLVYEQVFEKVLQFASSLYDSENLVLMGGCALNCLANRLIRKYFSHWWILPSPGDSGSSLGAAAVAVDGPVRFNTPYLGRAIVGEYPVDSALEGLLRNECIALASGRAEFGPRAFGNRSLLADPRGERTKDNVNLIKKRESFRPFAPVVLEEHFASLFDTRGDHSCPYMQCVYEIKRPDLFPAVTHVDGTSRVQTVNAKQHPELYALLSQFYKATGCPMLLNTSLNIKGMPLVNDEDDARRFSEKYGVPIFGIR
jgi:carbamoyltransferase